MAATGSINVNFGVAPGSYNTSVTVTGQTGILAASSNVEAFVMGDTTSDHSADEHAAALLSCTCGSVIDNTGFTITVWSPYRLTGQFSIRWVWV